MAQASKTYIYTFIVLCTFVHVKSSPLNTVKVTEFVCEDNVMQSGMAMLLKIPMKVLLGTYACLKDSATNLEDSDQQVSCPDGKNRVVRKEIYNALINPIEFAVCTTQTIQKLNNDLTEREMDNLKEIKGVAMKFFEQTSHF